MTSGGSLTMTRWPSTTRVNLFNARIESLVIALDVVFAAAAAMWATVLDPDAAARRWSASTTPSISTFEYQTSRLDIEAIIRMASRYRWPRRMIASRRFALEKPR